MGFILYVQTKYLTRVTQKFGERNEEGVYYKVLCYMWVGIILLEGKLWQIKD